ncbi:MAG: hypothetical protein ACLUW6_02060 [Coriobacteriaceae bacterium]
MLHDWIIDNVSYDRTYRNIGVDRALAGMAVTCEVSCRLREAA